MTIRKRLQPPCPERPPGPAALQFCCRGGQVHWAAPARRMPSVWQSGRNPALAPEPAGRSLPAGEALPGPPPSVPLACGKPTVQARTVRLARPWVLGKDACRATSPGRSRGLVDRRISALSATAQRPQRQKLAAQIHLLDPSILRKRRAGMRRSGKRRIQIRVAYNPVRHGDRPRTLGRT